MGTFIALLAGIGVGSIIAAFINWLVAISGFRQAWINALRDDLSTYFQELEKMHYVIGDLLRERSEANERKKREARIVILFVYSRIVLRLNRTEKMHIELRQKLDELMTTTETIPDRAKVEEVVDLARKILKQEWNVTKYGPAAPLVIKAKKWWRASN
jgi:hypothetical protein